MTRSLTKTKGEVRVLSWYFFRENNHGLAGSQQPKHDVVRAISYNLYQLR